MAECVMMCIVSSICDNKGVGRPALLFCYSNNKVENKNEWKI